MKRRHYSNFNLAGFTYWDGALVLENLKIGTQLRFKRELDNKYDAKAVAIYYGKHKLGFVPRSENAVIAKFLEQGYTEIFDARINRISREELPENQIGVVVHLLKNKINQPKLSE